MSVSSRSSYRRKTSLAGKKDIEIPADLVDSREKTSRIFRHDISKFLCRMKDNLPVNIKNQLQLRDRYLTVEQMGQAYNSFIPLRTELKRFPTWSSLFVLVATQFDPADRAKEALAILTDLITNYEVDEKIVYCAIPLVWNSPYIDDIALKQQFCSLLVSKYTASKFYHLYVDFVMELKPGEHRKAAVLFLEHPIRKFRPGDDELNRIEEMLEYICNQANSTTGDRTARDQIIAVIDEVHALPEPEPEPVPQKTPRRSIAGKWSDKASVRSGVNSASAPDMETLNMYLDHLEMHDVHESDPILKNIYSVLRKLKAFPKERDIKPLVVACLIKFSESEDESATACDSFNILHLLNTLPERGKELLSLYTSSVNNPDIVTGKLERVYQDIRRKYSSKMQLPITLTAKGHDEVSNEIEHAFTCLAKWESSYDGVQRVWNLFKANPNLNLIRHFENLEFTQKCFLVQGLKMIAPDEIDDAIDNAIMKLENVLYDQSTGDKVREDATVLSQKLTAIQQSPSPHKRMRSSMLVSPERSPGLQNGDVVSFYDE